MRIYYYDSVPVLLTYLRGVTIIARICGKIPNTTEIMFSGPTDPKNDVSKGFFVGSRGGSHMVN